MMAQEFTIPGRLTGLNDYVDACRKRANMGGRVKHQQQAKVEQAIREAGLKPMSAPVDVRITWYERDRRRDKDNVRFAVKFILDALVAEKVIENDNWEWVRAIADEYRVDKSDPRIHVLIEETKGEAHG